jgi:hypothetical protein
MGTMTTRDPYRDLHEDWGEGPATIRAWMDSLLPIRMSGSTWR